MHAEGDYKVRATSWGLTETKNGNGLFRMNFSVLGKLGEEGSVKSGETSAGAWSIAITENTIDWLMGNLMHLGYDRGDLLGLDPESPAAFNFEGKEFTARLKYKEHEGQSRPEWTMVTKAKMPMDRLLALNAKFESRIKDLQARREGKPIPPESPGNLPY